MESEKLSLIKVRKEHIDFFRIYGVVVNDADGNKYYFCPFLLKAHFENKNGDAYIETKDFADWEDITAKIQNKEF